MLLLARNQTHFFTMHGLFQRRAWSAQPHSKKDTQPGLVELRPLFAYRRDPGKQQQLASVLPNQRLTNTKVQTKPVFATKTKQT